MEQQFNLQVATLIKADGETKELVPNNGSGLNEKASQLLKEILGPNVQDLYGNIIFLPKKMF